MRVAHIIAHPPFREGTGTACYYTAQALRDLGVDVTVYAPAYQLRQTDYEHTFYQYMPCYLAVANAFLTPHILNIRHADILHLHFPFIWGSELVLLNLRQSKRPLIVTYHNDLRGKHGRALAFFLYNQLMTPLILRAARKIAVISRDHAESSLILSRVLHHRSDDVVDVGNGVRIDRFHPQVDPTPVRHQHNLAHDTFVILFVSSLDRAHHLKGLSLLLDALAAGSLQNYRLLIAGDGDMRLVYEQYARTLGIYERVIFLGRLPHARLPLYYAASDSVIVPSRLQESFGLTLAEGMASGKPVIGSHIPGVRVVVEDGVNGFLIPPGDQRVLTARIHQLAEDAALRQRMGQAGRQRIVQHFTWQKVAERLHSLYQDVLNQS